MYFLKFFSTYLFLTVHSCSYLLHARTLSNVQVTLRGKKYRVPCTGTVGDLQYRVEQQSGVSAAIQGRVLFAGKHLKTSEKLEDVGIIDGSIVNVVPNKFLTKRKSAESSRPKKYTKNNVSGDRHFPGAKSRVANEILSKNSELNPNQYSTKPAMSLMEKFLERAGIDSHKLEEMKKIIPLGPNNDIPDLEKTADFMQSMLDNPLFHVYMNDPVKVEQGRQLIIKNPLVSQIIKNLPGFDEVLNDPLKWRQTMIEGISMYKNIGSDIKNAVKSLDSRTPELGNSWGEINDKCDSTLGKLSALDELSEEDDL